MRKYNKPTIEIILSSAEDRIATDVIRTSNVTGEIGSPWSEGSESAD